MATWKVSEVAVSASWDDNARGTNAGSVLVLSGADLSLVCRLIDPSGGDQDLLALGRDALVGVDDGSESTGSVVGLSDSMRTALTISTANWNLS